MRTRYLAAFAAVFMMVLAATPAQADSISVGLVSITPSGSGTWLWTYEASLSPGSAVTPGSTPGAGIIPTSSVVGDWFTVNDFSGFLGVVTTPAGWSFTSYALGATNDTFPYSATPDSAGVPNLTWYSSSFSVTNAGASPIGLGLFVAESLYGASTLGFYTSRDVTSGVYAGHGGRVSVPVVPLPAAAWMGIALLGSVGGAGFFRKRRQTAL